MHDRHAEQTHPARVSEPRLAPLAGRGWRWLDDRGLQSLGTAGLAALAATVMFAGAGLLRSGCGVDCPGYRAVPAGVLGTIGALAILAGLAAVGHWIGHVTHRTWSERLRLEMARLEMAGEDAAHKARLERLIGDEEVMAIHTRGRASLWTGLPVAVAALVTLPFSMGGFGDTGTSAPYLFPLLALAGVAAAAATIRGMSLLRAAKRLWGDGGGPGSGRRALHGAGADAPSIAVPHRERRPAGERSAKRA